MTFESAERDKLFPIKTNIRTGISIDKKYSTQINFLLEIENNTSLKVSFTYFLSILALTEFGLFIPILSE